jgi:hypothetical protein
MSASTFALPGHAARRLAAPVCVRATSGLLWVTVDGDPEDILLAAGEARRFDRGRSVVVYALGGDAGVEVLAAGPRRSRARLAAEGLANRIAAWWHGGPAACGGGA